MNSTHKDTYTSDSFLTKQRAKEREAVVDNLVHDIKNNLMSIKGYLHIISKQLAAESKEKLYIDNANSKLNSITELLNELSSLKKITDDA